MSDWNTYRTRFLVRAKQLTEPLQFTDALGREHRGRPGDYLVESSSGLMRIAPREIFEDVYVPMSQWASVTPIHTSEEVDDQQRYLHMRSALPSTERIESLPNTFS